LITQDKNAKRCSTKRQRHILILLAIMLFASGTFTRAADTITWEAYPKAILRIDGEPPKVWGLYHSTKGKKDEVILLLWNKRYLMLNTHLKEVEELDPQTIVYKTRNLESPNDDKTATLLPSSDWIVRDVGSAFRIRTILTEEKHEIEINLPH
jgi:hypothetical protein